jgi:4-hydroxy-tetrahydrodipicolinate reductase
MAAPEPAAARPVRAALIGATGRMGRALLREATGFARLRITGAIASAGSASLGRDAGELAGLARLGVPVSCDLPRALADADVALDFSHPGTTREHLLACRAARTPLLVGTTGFEAALEEDFAAAAREIALLIAANTSLGVTVLVELVRLAAASLPSGFDIDIVEMHHRTKRDAPSGTALALAAAAQAARAAPHRGTGAGSGAGTGSGALSRSVPTAASGARGEEEIRFAAVRAGDLVGEHTALFCGPGEQLAFTHRASDRGIFARGALAAALWLQSRPAGRYAMRDVVAMKTST